MKNLLKIAFYLNITLLVAACSKTVTRIDPNTQVDLSGRWNDTDSRLVAEEMSQDALSSSWVRNIELNDINASQPVIIVGMITNKSHEHIEAETFIKDIEREFIKSNRIRVVQNSVFREKLREERADQQEFASPETQKKWGRELGADYMMFGNISSIVDQEGKRKVMFYQVNLELTNIETNEIVWIGDKKIKKYVRN
ncbi:MAG: penicillin-binding protein activator LpoB [Microscillaceae bacterium]|nr:penicillin-binding protein activator LpoB [Microscillaceae bacterium]